MNHVITILKLLKKVDKDYLTQLMTLLKFPKLNPTKYQQYLQILI
ncbi:MAG: hypothetical protein FADNKDHG_01456 [Holosporales bacterium]